MIPTQTFENFPEFANAGEKTQPNEQKYAQGFLPSDTLPAEWQNWFLGGATRGITALDTGLSSVEAELNSVLTSRQESPDATKTNQLLTVLEKIKAEAILAAHPVGSLYWTSSSENPAVTFGGGTWKQIKDRFVIAAGDTYNEVDATGGSATVTLGITQIPAHTHGLNSHTHTLTPAGTVSSHSHGLNSHTHSFTPKGTVSSHSHGLNSHTHSIGAHSHGLNSHTHGMNHEHLFRAEGDVGDHHHSLNDHTHIIAAHNHGLNSHTHTIGAHAHGLNSHTHTFTPAGTVSKHTHSVGAHSHGLNSHTHSFSWEGSHTHSVLGRANSSTEFTTTYWAPYGRAFAMLGQSTISLTRYSQNYKSENYLSAETITVSGTTGAASGSTANSTAFNSGETTPTFSGTAGTTGAASGSTANSTAFNSGAAEGDTDYSEPYYTGSATGFTGKTQPNFTGKNALTQEPMTINSTVEVHEFKRNTDAATGNTANSTAFNSGAASGNTADTQPTFSGTAGTTGAASGNTANAQPTFSGTQGTTSAATGNTTSTGGSNGTTQSVTIMPPYVVKYCWERTA